MWPSDSPDLNVIEMVWAKVKKILYTWHYIDPIKDQIDLQKRLVRIWREQITMDFINSLVDSFLMRCAIVYDNDGMSINSLPKGKHYIEQNEIERIIGEVQLEDAYTEEELIANVMSESELITYNNNRKALTADINISDPVVAEKIKDFAKSYLPSNFPLLKKLGKELGTENWNQLQDYMGQYQVR